MEPYRPFVDSLVYEIYSIYRDLVELDTEIKMKLLEILSSDIAFNDKKRPLMIGLSNTTASLARCFSGDAKRLVYPAFS